ncbi:MAG: hypothetical protein ABJA79_07225 [Parafilimonas sp.]
MNESLTNKINIFLTVDLQTINSYFNAHDPSPLYKKQLCHQFEQYILKSVASARRNSIVFYKLKCTNEIDEQFAEPLMYAVRRHFSEKKEISQTDFKRFKRRTLILLMFSSFIIVVCHGLMPIILNPDNHVQSIIITSLDVLSWVMLWRPIDKLIFEWNPHLKEISILNKLATAEMMIVERKKETNRKSNSMLFAVSQTG